MLRNLVTAITISTVTLASSMAAKAETITLANGEWAPYLSENLPEAGYVSHLVKSAFEKAGIAVEYQFLPWKRGFEQSKAGKLDGSLVWAKTAEREQDFYFSEPVLTLKASLFVKTGNASNWDGSAESLAGLTIGGITGYSYGALSEWEKEGKAKLRLSSSLDSNLKLLANGRLDYVVEDSQVGADAIKGLALNDKINAVDPVLYESPYYVILSKKVPENVERLKALNEAIRAMQEDGSIAKITADFEAGVYAAP